MSKFMHKFPAPPEVDRELYRMDCNDSRRGYSVSGPSRVDRELYYCTHAINRTQRQEVSGPSRGR